MIPAAPDDLGASGERIEKLLVELRSMTSPPAWQRVEELIARLVGVYGGGLARVVEVLGGAGALDEAMWRRLCDDELVASLLLLHRLHPRSAEERVRLAIDRAAPRLAPASAELLALDGGVARVRLAGGSAEAAAWLKRAIEEAAPELAEVHVEPIAGARLFQIDLERSRGAGSPP